MVKTKLKGDDRLQRDRKYKKVMNIVSLSVGMIGTIFIAWIMISTMDVAIHNFNTPSRIGNWNMYCVCLSLNRKLI